MTKNTRNQSQNSYAGENCHDRAEQQSKNRSTNAQNSQTRNKSTNKAGNKTHPAVSAMRTMKRTRILNNMF